jgi:translation initiation factor IF-3
MAEMKEVRLGRSMKIDPHDVSIRIDQARRFLMEGHKVQIVQNFRGRELQHRRLGDARLREIVERLADISRVEMTPRLNGRRMSMILAPDKSKIDAIARRSKTPTASAPASTVPSAENAASAPAADSSLNASPVAAPPAKPRKSPPAGKTKQPTGEVAKPARSISPA